MTSRIESLRQDQLNARLAAANKAASLALQHLRERGIEASLIGSLKSGGFGFHSDIDILVTECPVHLIYAVEAELEDIMGGISFDVVYLKLLAEEKRERWLSHAH
jgi:predicted nucleotidyltransferase